jgi:hypothetical protein
MRRFGLLGVGLLFILAALAATAAFAVQPINLPTGTKKFTGAGEGGTFYHSSEGGIECSSATGLGEETASQPPSGSFKLDIEGCEGPFGTTCTGLGEATGVLLLSGTWTLVFVREVGGTFTGLTTATLFNVAEFHLSCGSLLLLDVRGEVLCLDLKPTEANTVHSYHCTGKSSSEPNEEWCMLGDVSEVCTGEWLRPKLEESFNEGSFKASTLLRLGNWKYEVSATGMI